MTVNRNKRQDRERTKEQILYPNTLSPEVGSNWLGHRTTSKASTLDTMLLNGATMPELKKVRGAINEHLRHLELDHGLSIKINGDIYKIDRLNLGISE